MTFPRPYSYVSVFLIAACVLVGFVTLLGNNETAIIPFLIADPRHPVLSDVLAGQFWRLLTPIFLHFGPLHLVFNMLWVWDLGRLMEAKKGIGYYVTFVVLVGLISNLAQYLLTVNPFFGGMSGVVYGLLGYLWMYGQYHPEAGFQIRQNTIVTMLLWFAACWTGFLGPIANWAHTAGLVIGIAWGFLASKVFVSRS
jgi:membrane associated rhomboid family serine protease